MGAPGSAEEAPFFSEVAAEVGLVHSYWNGMTGEQYLPEVMGGGGALLDFDRDGDLDVFVVQGHLLGPNKKATDAEVPAPPEAASGDRLFENRLREAGRSGALRFDDVTAEAGIASLGYGMGAIAADFDGDGWDDLYVLNLGANVMLRNSRDGTFIDVSEESGTDDASWSVAATTLDFDGDGLLDLYVVNYLDFKFFRHRRCPSETVELDYCGPLNFPGAQDRLYRNLGDGRFEDVADRVGLGAPESRGLGVIAADLDGDGATDLYVANDQMANHLFLNRSGRFVDEGLLSGAALNSKGLAEASMGVDAADFDHDGDLDLFLTHLRGETNTLYVNEGDGLFRDATAPSGLGAASVRSTGFGTAWIDADNDGLLDLITVNGAIDTAEAKDRTHPYPLGETNQLFVCIAGGTLGCSFEDWSSRAGGGLDNEEVSRGLAVGDLDNDGDADAIIFNNNAPLRLLRNDRANQSGWIGFVGASRDGKDDAVLPAGFTVSVTTPGGPIVRRARRDGSYASSHDPRVLVGLGALAKGRVEVTMRWPSGAVREAKLDVGRYHPVLPPAEPRPPEGSR